MTVSQPHLSESLRAGRRALEGVRNVRITRDFVWYPEVGHWALLVLIRVPEPSALVPAESAWYVRVQPHYPFGKIVVCPAQERGIRETFPHQALNQIARADVPWRSGAICLESPSFRPLGRLAAQPEPLDADRRLAWHVSRAADWLVGAATDTLLRSGDPYELPAWPSAPVGAQIVVFAEGVETLARWTTSGARCGRATLVELSPRHAAVLRWSDLSGAAVAETRWGAAISSENLQFSAAWMLMPLAPTALPWRAPLTWRELRAAAKKQGVELDWLLRRVATLLRTGARRILLVGFPIPATMGQPPVEVHWQPLVLPALPRPASRGAAGRTFARGFRNNDLGRWKLARQALFDDHRIEWHESQNWHSDRIGARGRLMETARLSRSAIIGVGALGSLMAELLVRQGAVDSILIDFDALTAGNLVRHRLGLDAVGENKATALAEELNLMSPHARVRACCQGLPWDLPDAHQLLCDRETVVDCTGDDAPLVALARNAWNAPKLFASASVGREARRLYFFTARGTSFPLDEFKKLVAPWLAEERAVARDDSPWEGAGCWHPLFRARLDDLMLMAATATKLLEAEVAEPSLSPKLQVFQSKKGRTGLFCGIERVQHPSQAEPCEEDA